VATTLSGDMVDVHNATYRDLFGDSALPPKSGLYLDDGLVCDNVPKGVEAVKET
jgi:hypothetical protein